MAVSHLAFDLGLGHQCGHRIDDDDVKRAGADQHIGDLQRLLAVVGLRDDQRIGVHAELLGVHGIQRMLGVDERRHAAFALGVGHHMQRQRGLARGLRAVDLHDAPLGQASDAQRHVQCQRTGGDHLHVLRGLVPQAHGRTLAEVLLHLRQRRIQRGLAARVNGMGLLGGVRGVLRRDCRLLCHDASFKHVRLFVPIHRRGVRAASARSTGQCGRTMRATFHNCG